MLRKISFVIVVSIALLLVNACNSDDPAPSGTDVSDKEYFGTMSPGDVWLVLFNPQRKTFAATWDAGTKSVATDDVVFSGSFSKTSKGFIEMKVTGLSRTVNGIAVDGTYRIYAMEIPGKSLVMLPDAPSAVTGAPKFGIVVMNARSTKSGSNGIHKFNFIRTAYPYQGYNHVDKDGCWGNFSWGIDEAGGTVSITEEPYSRTLTCVENKINSSFACVYTPDTSIPTGVTLGTIGSLGEFTQTASVGEDAGKKYTGQFNFTDGIFTLDQGDGQGGSFMFKQDPLISTDDFNAATFNQGGETGELTGFGTFLGARNGTGAYTLSNRAYSVYTDPRLPDGYISFHEFRGSIGASEVESNIVWAVNFEEAENGMLFGYLYSVVDNTLGSQRYPVVGMGYIKNGKKLIVMVSGSKASPEATTADQWVFALQTR